jgi:hypothetical protein
MNARDRIGLAASLLAVTGCIATPQSPSVEPPAPVTAPFFKIQNDPAVLEARLHAARTPLGWRAPAGNPQATTRSTATEPVTLVQVGELLPPQVAGHTVQACDLDISSIGRTVVVGCNVAGPVAAGAMQLVDFTHADRPRLVAEVLFPRADVHSVCKRGSYIYCGVSSDDPAWNAPVRLVEFRQVSSGVASTGRWLELPSHAVTDLSGDGDWLLASVGAQAGGIVLVDRVQMRVTGFAPAPDVRACAFDPNGGVVSLAGGDGGLGAWSLPDLESTLSATVDGLGYESAKGTLEAQGSYWYAGAGEGGFQVFGRDGTLRAVLPNAFASGHAASDCVTNAVSVAGRLAFIAAGALGVRVADLGPWSVTSPDPAANALTLLGEIDFTEEVSSNMVKVRGDMLVVAGGLGGVKLVRMMVGGDA